MTILPSLVHNQKAFFASDLHLGLPPYERSREREKKAVRWLDGIAGEARYLFLLGDVFDFWFEYRKVVPRGFVRFLGKLASLADAGVEIHLFSGNHDVWIFDYLPREIGLTVHHAPFMFSLNEKIFFVGHGDGLGPGDLPYKVLKWIFRNRILQWLYAHLIHPDLSMRIGHCWSGHSRYARGLTETFYGKDREKQILYALSHPEKEAVDYFLFGHRHIAYDLQLNGKSRIINLGEWITAPHYAVFDGNDVCLKPVQ